MRKYRDMQERLMANSVVDEQTGCWLWLGKRDYKGYGIINVWCPHRKKTVTKKAHRVAYEALVGPIPANYEIDHQCCIRHCIRPQCLKPVTGLENLMLRDQRRAA